MKGEIFKSMNRLITVKKPFLKRKLDQGQTNDNLDVANFLGLDGKNILH